MVFAKEMDFFSTKWSVEENCKKTIFVWPSQFGVNNHFKRRFEKYVCDITVCQLGVGDKPEWGCRSLMFTTSAKPWERACAAK